MLVCGLGIFEYGRQSNTDAANQATQFGCFCAAATGINTPIIKKFGNCEKPIPFIRSEKVQITSNKPIRCFDRDLAFSTRS